MKLSTSALAILAALTASTALAADKPAVSDRVFGSVFYEYYLPDGKKSETSDWSYMEKGHGYGLELGYNLDENWALRLDFARDHLKQLVGDDKLRGDRLGLNVVYSIQGTGLYLLGGLNRLDVETTEDSSAVNIGTGYRHYLNDNTSVYAEMNRFQGLDESYGDANVKVGMSVLFGDAPAAAEPTAAPVPVVAPAPADSDNDGVPDSSDLCPGTPTTDKVDATGCSIFTDKEVTFALKAQFANDSAVVKPEYDAEIAELAAFLKRYPGTSVEVGGHASNVGTPAYNLKLSQRRADAVGAILVNKHGIASSRVSSHGYGISRPKIDAKTPEAHAANRRIEAKVTATVKEKVER